MINPKSRSLEWITEAARQIGVRDITLVEKTIRAFSLLEALTRSGCPFIFKGGSSLMLHLNTSKRLSIDIDIICPPGTVIEEYLSMYAEEYGFDNLELLERISRKDVPKQHAKFYYEVSYPGKGSEQCFNDGASPWMGERTAVAMKHIMTLRRERMEMRHPRPI